MANQKIVSRKSFIRGLAWTGAGFMGWVWYRLSNHTGAAAGQPEYRHSSVPPGVSFHGKYYLFCQGNEVRAFSTTCSHAGCRLGTTTSGIIHCGCHGSQFEAGTGRPLKGPAVQSLQKFDCQFDAPTGQWVVKTREPEERSV